MESRVGIRRVQHGIMVAGRVGGQIEVKHGEGESYRKGKSRGHDESRGRRGAR